MQGKATYNFLEKYLHSLALNPIVADMSFDIESALYGKKSEQALKGDHVFVTGLARAGTSILLRQIFAAGEFASLTYRDMPFVLAPNAWRFIRQKFERRASLSARAHGDGMSHDYDTPEAFEEVFWRVKSGHNYIRGDSLISMCADDKILTQFQAYVSLVLYAQGKQRYLSKNNNNLIRLSSICRAFPDSHILVVFRDPLQQSYSLLQQHRHFLKMHEEDPFSRKYMQWLVHHEFGSDHKPFLFSDNKQDLHDAEFIEYWISLWMHVYSHILTNVNERLVFVCHEALCEKPDSVWPKLCSIISVQPKSCASMFQLQKPKENICIRSSITKEVYQIYSQMKERSLK